MQNISILHCKANVNVSAGAIAARRLFAADLRRARVEATGRNAVVLECADHAADLGGVSM